VRTVRGVHDPGAMCHAFDMLARWMLGDAEGATAGAARLRAMIPALAPYDAAFSSCADALLAALEGDIERCGAAAAQAAAVAEEQAFNAWEMMAAVLQGYSRALGHQPERGVAQMQRALEAWVATGAHNLRPLFLGLLAEAWMAQGQAGSALAAAQSGLEAMAGGERCWAPLLLGVQADALALQGDAVAARSCRDEALRAAQAMDAAGWAQRLREPRRPAARGLLGGWEGRRLEDSEEGRSEGRSEGQSA
jgi:predicted ATPase